MVSSDSNFDVAVGVSPLLYFVRPATICSAQGFDMEPVGLLLGSAQGIAQLAGVIKRHVASYNILHARASSIESKSREASRVAEQMNGLVEMAGLPASLLAEKLSDLQDAEVKLTSIVRRLSESSSFVNFFRAPILARELADVDFKMEQLDIFFRTIGLLSSVVVTQRQENRQMAFTIVSAFLSVSGDVTQQRQILRELESTWFRPDATHIRPRSREARAEEHFAMGLANFQPTTGGTIRPGIELGRIQSAVRFFRMSCNLGKKEAFHCLGDIFYHGYGVQCCFRTAVDTYKEGIVRGDAASKHRLASCFEFGHGVPLIPSHAAQLYREAAEEGCAESMKSIGFWSLVGHCVESNFGLAFRMLRRAVDLEVGGAKGDFAYCYDRGIGVERDSKKYFELLLDSFNEGNMFCIPDLAHCYDTGKGVRKNAAEGTKLYERMMKAGTWHFDFYKALYGLRLVQGLGTDKDEALGKAIIIDSTKSGNSLAWYALGECYRRGHGWDVNKTQAAVFYKRAVKCKNGLHGLVGSYEALGDMYESGEGVVACAKRSSDYYLSAAKKLSRQGQWKAGCAFELGRGQQEDLARAVYLFKISANSGHEGARRKTFEYYMKGHGLERPRFDVCMVVQEDATAGKKEMKKRIVGDAGDALVQRRRFTL